MKKIVALMLTVAMLLSLSSTAFAANTVVDTMPIHNAKIRSVTGTEPESVVVKTLSDWDGNSFELVESGNVGYYIFDTVSGNYLEYAPESASPYQGLSDGLLYFGPQNYFVQAGERFVHTVLGSEIGVQEINELQDGFTKSLENMRQRPDNEVLLAARQRSSTENLFRAAGTEYIPNYQYIKDGQFPENKGASCGYVAACLLLYWWHRTNPSANIIPSTYLTSSNELKITGVTLQDKLLSYGYDEASWGLPMRDCITDYANEFGIRSTISYYLGNVYIDSELSQGRPVILFGNLNMDPPQASTRGFGMHGVVVYGTYNYFYVANYGWKNSNGVPYNTCVYLNDGLFGSSTMFRLT